MRWRTLGNAALIGLVVAGAILSWQGLSRFWQLDPLAEFRSDANQDRNEVVIELRDVYLRKYDLDRLAGTARVDLVEMSRDRQTLWMRGVRAGRFYLENGDPLEYQGDLGVWNEMTGVLEAEGNLRVTHAKLDLTTDRLTYSRRSALLNVSGAVTGRLDRGQVEVASLRYDLKSGAYDVGQGLWTGLIQDTGAATPRERWTIRVQGGSRQAGSDVEVWTNAEATDGLVTVRAERIERNVKTDVLIATGNVRYFGTDADLTCRKVTVYRRERRAVLEGEVSMLIKAQDTPAPQLAPLEPLRPQVPAEVAEGRPAPPTRGDADRALDEELRSPESRRKYPTAVLAERIEYWYAQGSRRAVITGSPQARQELAGGRWRSVWAHQAKYDGEQELLRLESRPSAREVRVQTSIGDDLTAEWFEVSTAEGREAWSGAGIEGVLAPEEGEIPEREGGGVTAPPPNLRGPIGPARPLRGAHTTRIL